VSLDSAIRLNSGFSLAALLHTLLAVATCFVAITTLPGSLRAQEDWGASYITPFPQNDVYRMQVIGDWMAEGLFSAVNEAFRSDTRVRLPSRIHSLNGLIRMRPEDFFKFEESVKSEPMHIAILMLGIGDRIPLRAPDGRRVNVGSDEWKEEYGRRVDRVIRALKRSGAAVYWVGLPIVRRPDMDEDVRMLNSVFRERALLNNVKFIDVYDTFADEAGHFTQYGPDLTGKQRLLRAEDGVALTTVGNRKLAYFVEREIKRDLTQAKNERDIPLAGSEAEQRRISPKAQQEEAAKQQSNEQGSGWAAVVERGSKASPNGSSGGALKADNSKIKLKTRGNSGKEEETTIEILRPAIPASVVAIIARQQSPDRPAQLGDTISETLPGGVTVMSSITPALTAGSQAQRRRLAPTQSPFFKVLVKGERLPPKPGRADDFRWPPTEAERAETLGKEAGRG